MSNNNNNNSHNNNSNNNNSNNNFDDNIINKKKKNKKRQIEDSEEDESDNNNEFFQALVTKKNKLKRKDIDDLDLNKKIIIIENKKRKLNNFNNINVIHNNNNNNNNNIETLEIFNPNIHKTKWTSQWMLSKKSTHCLYDIRYLLSIKNFMEYICFKSSFEPMKHFWIRLLNLLSTNTHSKYQHRQCGKQHILMEDQTMVNILRLEHTINGTNHRYLLNSLNNLFNNIKNDKIKINKVLNMLENVLHYGLNMINKKPYDNFDLYFPNIENENE
eukprot:61075_1